MITDSKFYRGNQMKPVSIKYFEWLSDSYPKIDTDLSNSSTRSLNLKEFNIVLSDEELGPPGLGGNPKLREKISELYQVPEKNILLSPGSTMSNFSISSLLLHQGDNVVVETPTYEPFLRIPEAFGVEILKISRKFENGFGIDINELNELVNKQTKIIMFTNYNNPTANGLFRGEIKAMAEIAEDVDAYLLCDEVYREFGFENQPPTVYSVSPERGITTDSMTKVYGLGGIRVGWSFCDENIVDKATTLIELTTLINSTVGEHLGIELFNRIDQLRERTRKILNENYPIIKQWLNKHTNLLEVSFQQPLNFCFPKVKEGLDVDELTDHLIKKYKILIAPGRFFGEHVKDHFRIGWAYFSKEKLVKCLEKFDEALEELI
jgi:aspartate/methionine/tyrosine aminotransferase